MTDDQTVRHPAYVASCGGDVEICEAAPAIIEALGVLRAAGFDAAIVARFRDDPQRWEIETTEQTIEGAQQFAGLAAYLLRTHVAEARQA